jgi:hypothetical protein
MKTRKKMLPPLGGSEENGQMWFFAADVEHRCHDRKWMDKMTRVPRANVHVKSKNSVE